MDLGLTDRVAIVCGASQGMGRAIAIGLAREGARVVVAARSTQGLEELAQTLRAMPESGGVLACPVDLSTPEAAGELVQAAVQTWGRLDIVVNNTGGPPPGQPTQFTDEDWQGAFEKNFFNVVRMARAAVPVMREAGYGRIINMLALSVRQVEDNLALSSTARLAASAFAKALSDEVAQHGITVNNLLPGSILTDRLQAVSRMQAEFHGQDPEQAMAARLARIPAGRFGAPQEMADLVCFLASERAGFLTALNIPVDGGQLRSMS